MPVSEPVTGHPFRLKTVEVKPAEDQEMFPGCYVVTPVYEGVDRPRGTGIYARRLPLAQRLVTAIEAGAALVPRGVRRDIHGHTYVDERVEVRARCLNADLRKLGY